MGLFSGVTKAVGSLFGGDVSGSSSGAIDPTTAAVQFGADTLTGYINNYYSRKAMKRQFDYNKALIDYQNEYNSPVNQMKRLEEAGLNPNLVYGNGNAIIGSGSGSVSAQHGTQSPTNLLMAYNLEAQNNLLAKQGELAEAQKKLTNQNAYLSQANTALTDLKKSKAFADKSIALYNADYAQAEHEAWRRTGKIPESYYRNQGTPQLLMRIFDNLAGL